MKVGVIPTGEARANRHLYCDIRTKLLHGVCLEKFHLSFEFNERVQPHSMGETNTTTPTAVEEKPSTGIQHFDGTALVLSSDVNSAKVWNPLLVAACLSFGAASMLFGYDGMQNIRLCPNFF
jgi:hypothetical protein